MVSAPASRRLLGGAEKVSGRAIYAADTGGAGLLHARPVLSEVAAGRLLGIETARARAVPGVVAVLTAADLPRWTHPLNARVSALLARDRVAFAGQPVAVVVAESEAAAADAAGEVEVALEPLPALANAAAALAPGARVVWPDGVAARGFESQLPPGAGPLLMDGTSNVLEHGRHARGSVEAGLARADAVVAATYTCPAAHQGYLEPHAALAIPGPGGTLTIHTATRGPFHVRAWIARLLDLPLESIRVVPAVLGGSFGGKCGIVEPLVAAVALALDRPVRLVLTRSEDMRTTTPGPAVTVELTLGATRRGRLTALRGRIVVDDGAFPLGLGGLVADVLGGAYRCPAVEVEWRDVLTNRPQGGPLRAPGGPQAAFALESALDELACRLGLDPLELRLANAAGAGDPSGLGRPWPRLALSECLEALRAHPAWRHRERRPGEGAGVAAGILLNPPGRAAASCRVDRAGAIHLELGTVDVSGAHTALAPALAAALGVPAEAVIVVPCDTATSPESDITGASRTTFATAVAVRAAAGDLLARLDAAPGSDLGALVRRSGQPSVRSRAEVALEGRPVAVAHVVRVAVDAATGATRAQRCVAAQDAGFVFEPALAAAQVQGGVCQGLGLALLEELVYDDAARPRTATLGDYALPTIDVPPPLDVLLLERPGGGPADALGVGEPPLIPAPAAVANAIHDAVGARVRELPLTPERVWRALP